MNAIRCGREICGDVERAATLEWLETNGLGGFASGTVVGMNTRRYHGLLMAATAPPVGRMLMLSRLEETFVTDGKRFELAVNRYPGVVHPDGFRHLREFRLDPFPVWVFELGVAEIEKRVFMPHGENSVVVEYEVRGAAGRLELRPLIAFRDYHSTTHRNDGLDPGVDISEGLLKVAPYHGVPPLYLAHNAEEVGAGNGWYLNFEFDRERERGLDYHEDLFNPMQLRFNVEPGRAAVVIGSLEPLAARDAEAMREKEIRRRRAVVAASPVPHPLVERLTAAADQFIVKRGDFKTVIAGYHWFSDWGRDTMIALPGLTLATGRPEVARPILQTFAASMSQGMLPNRFPDAGETPEYNTVDATLWFFEAVRAYLEYTDDYPFVRDNLYRAMKDSINWHLRGTRYSIRVDGDALLACGEPGVQLTWMDSKIGDWVVTPRSGKPVEIQALWYNALRVMQDLAGHFDDRHVELFLRELADQARSSFNNVFWNNAAGCLYDVVNGDERDRAIRPNQILAVSLNHSMLDEERARGVVSVVERELRTPLGLRSLSPHDPQYRPRYEGGVQSRDSAYHQGTVWPWLMGPFLSAYIKVNGNSQRACEQARAWLDGIQVYLEAACLGQLAEIADGDAPHHPRGCVAQAWSVAEILRAAVEDVYAGGLKSRRVAVAAVE